MMPLYWKMCSIDDKTNLIVANTRKCLVRFQNQKYKCPRSRQAACLRGMNKLCLHISLSLFGLNVSASAHADGLRPWNEYHAIMWVGDSAGKKREKLGLFYQRLRDMGINTAMA